MKKKARTKARPTRVRNQREVLREVMLAAGECHTWLTLLELSRLTHFGEASISAQLRHLRKQQFGGYVIQKRQREVDEIVRADGGVVWEYKLNRGLRRVWIGRPVHDRGVALKEMQVQLPANC